MLGWGRYRRNRIPAMRRLMLRLMRGLLSRRNRLWWIIVGISNRAWLVGRNRECRDYRAHHRYTNLRNLQKLQTPAPQLLFKDHLPHTYHLPHTSRQKQTLQSSLRHPKSQPLLTHHPNPRSSTSILPPPPPCTTSHHDHPLPNPPSSKTLKSPHIPHSPNNPNPTNPPNHNTNPSNHTTNNPTKTGPALSTPNTSQPSSKGSKPSPSRQSFRWLMISACRRIGGGIGPRRVRVAVLRSIR